ncbi:adenylate/guanylate cyclase domain-containing protein [Shimia sp. SDUM112013]|uniref:adenylate/guanylate cyclase domain-containing protein n=1 Tax=Shimia sp. SDUM112013 TaxID=3136160 RepID=UPI0032EDD6C3
MYTLRKNLGTLFLIIALGGVLGGFYTNIVHEVYGRETTGITLLRGAERGALVAVIVIALEALVSASVAGRLLRRLPFGPGLIVRGIITFIILRIALSASHIILIRDPVQFEIWAENGLRRDIFFAALFAFVIQFFIQTRRLIGARTLRNFLLGRYARPVQEKRLFVLADLAGSTEMADRLGDQAALSMITSVFLDIDPMIQRHGGEIHNYVGDEIIMSWPMKKPARNARALRCVAEILTCLDQRRAHYIESFGIAPSLRMGIAGGKVAVGECGWGKRQVVYIGDTINVAKRLQDMCKEHGLAAIMDADLIPEAPIPDGLTPRDLGTVTLRGHQHATRMIGLPPANAPANQLH